MPRLKFDKTGVDPDTGEPLFRLVINGRTVREDLTLDQVIEAINRQDEEGLLGNDRHSGVRRDADGNVVDYGIVGPPGKSGAAKERGPLSPAEAGQLPLQGSHGDAEARRKARREPGWRR